MGLWKDLFGGCTSSAADEPASQRKGQAKQRKAQEEREQQQARQQQQHQQQRQRHHQEQQQRQQHARDSAVPEIQAEVSPQTASPRSAAPAPTDEGGQSSPHAPLDPIVSALRAQQPEVSQAAAHTQTPAPPAQHQSSTQTLPAEQPHLPDQARELTPNVHGQDATSQTQPQPPSPPAEQAQPSRQAVHTQTSPHLFIPPSAPAHTQTADPPPVLAQDTQTSPRASDPGSHPPHTVSLSVSHQPAGLAKDTQTSPRSDAGSSDSDLPEHVSLNQVLFEEEQAVPMVSLREAYAQQQERAEAHESMAKQLEEQQQQYEALSCAHAGLQQQLEQQQEQQQQHAALGAAHAALQQQHSLLKQQHASTQQQLVFLEQHQGDLQHKCVGQQQQLTSLRASHTQLQRGLGDLHMLLQSLGLLAHDSGVGVQDGCREDQDHDGVSTTETTSLQLAQIAAGCKAQRSRAADYEARQEQLARQLEAAKMERASIQESYSAAFDAGEAARVQVLQLREELDSLRGTQQPAQAPPEHRTTELPSAQHALEAASAKSAALEVKLQEKERQMHSVRMEQERAVEEQQRLRQLAESAEAAAQAFKERLEESKQETARARQEAEQLSAALSSNDLVNAHTAGQTDALHKDYTQLKEKHLALLTEMDAKHNMIELLAHQFEEVEGPDLRAVAARTKRGGRSSPSARAVSGQAPRANGGP